LIGCAPIVASEPANDTNIRLLRVAGQAADLKFIDELLTQYMHSTVSLGRPPRCAYRALGPPIGDRNLAIASKEIAPPLSPYLTES
jgi:hypothetical protein